MTAYQLQRVRALVTHAARRVPAYAAVLEVDDGERVRDRSDLAGLPTVDKAHFLALDNDERSWMPPAADPHLIVTSGTTGQPFCVPWGRRALWHQSMQGMWMMRAMGIRPTDLQVTITPPSRLGRRQRRGLNKVLGSRRLQLSESTEPAELSAQLRHLRPAWISGQAHVLLALGEHLRGAVRPRHVTTYGISIDDAARGELTEMFGVRPLDIYGCSETGGIAYQCRAGDLYHLHHDAVLLEVVDDSGQPATAGQLGEVVLTGLFNPLLPMIRYRIGDSAVLSDRPCRCGQRLPALARVEGRTFDWLVDDAGRRVAPQRLWMSTVSPRHRHFARRYRVVQSADGSVVIEIEPSDAIDEQAEASELAVAYQTVLGAGTPMEVRFVQRIELNTGERFRQFRSDRRPSP